MRGNLGPDMHYRTVQETLRISPFIQLKLKVAEQQEGVRQLGTICGCLGCVSPFWRSSHIIYYRLVARNRGHEDKFCYLGSPFVSPKVFTNHLRTCCRCHTAELSVSDKETISRRARRIQNAMKGYNMKVQGPRD